MFFTSTAGTIMPYVIYLVLIWGMLLVNTLFGSGPVDGPNQEKQEVICAARGISYCIDSKILRVQKKAGSDITAIPPVNYRYKGIYPCYLEKYRPRICSFACKEHRCFDNHPLRAPPFQA